MTYDPDGQAKADKYVADWARGKMDFEKVRHRMGEIAQTDINLVSTGRQGLGVVRNGQIDLDHAYHLAKLAHPETLSKIRKAEQRERSYTAPAEKRDPGPTVRETILKSMRENAERG
jgi:hypothetical protein